MTESPITMYDWFKGHDVLEWLRPLWDGGGWMLNKDGKVEMIRNQVAINTPWVHHGHTDWAKCMLWNNIMFRVVSENITKHFSDMKPFVPSGCQNCYKVVVRPKTLTQLFALNELEIKLGRPSKCGIEHRDSVHGLYGGYFYNRGIEAGRECYQTVRQAIDEIIDLGPEVKVILKRSCTEMEHSVGPSDKWEISEEQSIVESLIEEWTVSEKDVSEQPEPVVWNVKRRWIEWAFAHGDETYKQFTGGKSITPGYITYHQGV